jgi:hypothetical protein
VALRAGEWLDVAPSATGTARLVAHRKDRGWTASYGRADYWGEQLSVADVSPDRTAHLRALNTSWYRLELDLHDVTEEVSILRQNPVANRPPHRRTTRRGFSQAFPLGSGT